MHGISISVDVEQLGGEHGSIEPKQVDAKRRGDNGTWDEADDRKDRVCGQDVADKRRSEGGVKRRRRVVRQRNWREVEIREMNRQGKPQSLAQSCDQIQEQGRESDGKPALERGHHRGITQDCEVVGESGKERDGRHELGLGGDCSTGTWGRMEDDSKVMRQDDIESRNGGAGRAIGGVPDTKKRGIKKVLMVNPSNVTHIWKQNHPGSILVHLFDCHNHVGRNMTLNV